MNAPEADLALHTRIRPCSAHAFELKAGESLVVIDPQGQQVSDLVAFSRADSGEYLSSGRSIDYASKIWLSTNDVLYSNRSRPMFLIQEDTCGRHDFMLTPCSKDTFLIIYGETAERPGCQGNLAKVLERFNIASDQIPVPFNIFMHVDINPKTGAIAVRPPLSAAGDYIRLQAKMDLVVGLTACSAGQSNNFSFKPIDFRIEKAENFS
ncbi:MAG TPA: urea carboxylase-associated family protein [Limnobacter sp.]|nr:urea carboxylase-associated family protein [Limnobacter sp.]